MIPETMSSRQRWHGYWTEGLPPFDQLMTGQHHCLDQVVISNNCKLIHTNANNLMKWCRAVCDEVDKQEKEKKEKKENQRVDGN